MTRPDLADAAFSARLGKVVIAVSGVTVAVMAVLAVRVFLLHAQHGQALRETASNRAAIKEAEATIEKSANLNRGAGEEGVNAVSAFQAFLVDGARERGCIVREAIASSDSQPYLTRYRKDTPVNEYLQLGFKAVIDGEAQAVMETLKGVTDSPIPFEFDSLGLRRTGVRDGRSSVEVTVQLRVLSKGGAS